MRAFVLRIAIDDQVPLTAQHTVGIIKQVPTDLKHPRFIWPDRHADNMHDSV
jgi:hypothetical protein